VITSIFRRIEVKASPAVVVFNADPFSPLAMSEGRLQLLSLKQYSNSIMRSYMIWKILNSDGTLEKNRTPSQARLEQMIASACCRSSYCHVNESAWYDIVSNVQE
jgi:hypothetical protein